jgi:DNA polymerase II large subunit
MNKEYADELMGKIESAYDAAEKGRACGFDPARKVEAIPAGDLASRVEGLVGPEGIAAKIKEFGRDNLMQIMDYVLGDISALSRREQEKQIEQALRTALAVTTEGVVAAPIEGIAHVAIKSNPDGSEYLAVYFSGPIRSAGGTAQGLAVLFSDYLRRKANLQEYRPTKEEVERYVEEIKIYNDRVSHLQYKPPEDDIREIVNHCPVCIDGDPTEKREVSIHRNLARVETNRIRGGMCLVTAEGIAQKARKLMKFSTQFGLGWDWLGNLGKKKAKTDENIIMGFMAEIVGGRPIFAEPGAKGGFRLRYGKGRTTCIAAKAMHPAVMILLDSFIATGTQVKIERPGKGCIITECDTIEAPMIRLRDGSVRRIESVEEAKAVKDQLAEILFLGDILITYGDFLQTNTTLLPAGYCEEWWALELAEKGISTPGHVLSPAEAVEFSRKNDVPLHPRYTYHWDDVSLDEVNSLVCWLSSADIGENLRLKNTNPVGKSVLESLGVPHTIEEEHVVVDEFVPLLCSLGIYENDKMDIMRFSTEFEKSDKSAPTLEFLNRLSSVFLRAKSGTYIGARMGRPEKARERKMQPPVHSLFPIGFEGGSERHINHAAEKNTISIDVSRFECEKCSTSSIFPTCSTCNGPAKVVSICPSCGRTSDKELCVKCKTPMQGFERRDVDIRNMWKGAVEKLGFGGSVKGVQGMISFHKVPEPLEKGILRAKHDVFVFKDGTIRFDATDAPLTHFRPREVAVSVEKLKELGYTVDYLGVPLSSEEQVLELKVQDILLATEGAKYLQRVAAFIDDLLTKFYGLPSFYNVHSRDELLGHLVVGLAPHTSAGIVGRIVGFNPAAVCYAHPFWHAAKRRNADGDEDSVMLMLDALLNFSKMYLPARRGGKMDAPLVITTLLDPKEVDDEAHKIEIVDHYPLSFYEATWQNMNPSAVDIPIVASVLDDEPAHHIRFTHDTGDITGPVLESRYVTLGTMEEKVAAQLKVAELTRAIDESTVAELVINSHFMRDTYGNLRAFSKQKFRCVKCNHSYRRVPLSGKCNECGGKLLLTVTEGSIRKYLDISINLAEKYSKSDYLKQRLKILKKEIDSAFTNDLNKQMSLSEYM